jgi:hypothetical protein
MSSIFAVALLSLLGLAVLIVAGYAILQTLEAQTWIRHVSTNARAVLVGFTKLVDGEFDEGSNGFWVSRFPSVRFYSFGVVAELTFATVQGASKMQNIVVPFLHLTLPDGERWVDSPGGLVRAALASRGHTSRRIAAFRNGYAVYIQPNTARTYKNRLAELVEGTFDADTLHELTSNITRAARGVVTSAPPRVRLTYQSL